MNQYKVIERFRDQNRNIIPNQTGRCFIYTGNDSDAGREADKKWGKDTWDAIEIFTPSWQSHHIVKKGSYEHDGWMVP